LHNLILEDAISIPIEGLEAATKVEIANILNNNNNNIVVKIDAYIVDSFNSII
jgi:hypothetical protein